MDALEHKFQQYEGQMHAHGPMIYTLLTRLTGDPIEGAKLMEVTFLWAYKQLPELADESKIGNWFYRIAITVWKNQVLKAKKQFSRIQISETFTHKGDKPEGEILGLDAPLMMVGENIDRNEAVKHAMSQLGPEERALVVLRDMDNLSYEEISNLLDLPLDSLKTRIPRVREYLRRILLPIIRKAL